MKKELTVKLGQVADYEIRLLKVFKAVVECGGFAAAETELNIGRSTISTHVANLEQRLFGQGHDCAVLCAADAAR